MKLKPTVLAMILAGGRVDELSVLTAYRPKSTVPFAGFARIIDCALSNLMQSDLDRVAILSQYRSFSLINHIGSGAAWDMLGRYRGVSILPPFQGFEKSSWYRGTADAVYQNLDFVHFYEPQDMLILSGDHVYHMDYRKLIDYHHEKDADMTMACVHVPMDGSHRFGLAEIDDEDGERGGRIISYEEKPAEPKFKWASMTVYCFKSNVLYDVLEANAMEDDSYEFGKNIIPRLLAAKRKVYGYKFKGYWGYTRTLDEYWQTSMDLLGPAPKINLDEWGLRTNLEQRGMRDCQPMKLGEHASVQNSLIYNGCVVEGTVENSILFPRVYVQPGAVVRDSIIFFDNVIGQNVRLDKAVVDVNVEIGDGCQIGEEGPPAEKAITVIGWNSQIPPNTMIGSGCTLHPYLKPGMVPQQIKSGEVVR